MGAEFMGLECLSSIFTIPVEQSMPNNFGTNHFKDEHREDAHVPVTFRGSVLAD